jgi:hypothetical protein
MTIDQRLDHIGELLEGLSTDKVEIYQKASQQIVNLAFGLLLTVSLAIIIPAVLNR